MKRLTVLSAFVIAAVTSIVWAATASAPVNLILPSGIFPVRVVEENGELFFSADDLIKGLGGTLSNSEQAYRATVGSVEAAFGTDSKLAIVSDTMLELSRLPVVVDGTPYLPLPFFQTLAKAALRQAVSFTPADRALRLQAIASEPISPQVSVVNLQGMSKVVIQLAAAVDYSIAKDAATYTIRFKAPVRAPFGEQAYDDPHVSRILFLGSDLKIQLTAEDVAGSAYRLDNPFRIVLDLQKGVSSIQEGLVAPPRTETQPQDLPGIRTIVIDPGHGGKDVGATGLKGLLEKDATLAIAQKLSPMLSRRLNVRVILTRTGDSSVSLDERTSIANQYKGDLFLSIHLNAARTKGARGSETYFLSLEASDELARKAAERENRQVMGPTQIETATSSDLRLILWDLAQQDYLKESSHLAEVVQVEMDRASGLPNRGVKQAPFKVLVGATMPAALVEVSFISNEEDEAKLRTPEFQTSIAATLAAAIERFKKEYDARNGLGNAPPVAAKVAPAPTSSTTAPVTQ
ncbi:MAG TPA: N-acetylmuramoyl-L-alanine amidase [Thermoanaerobaculia bacterium]|nr:N-acetylmuramoyl-L-alanine amidase [Thermoanaerobaculia bacterium]